MKSIKGKLFTANETFEYGEVIIAGNIIYDVVLCDKELLTESEQKQLIIPGLVDIHMHGAVGNDICSCDANELIQIAEYEKKNGIMSFCPATMTLEKDKLISICKMIAETKDETDAISGIYLEGPFIAESKAGAQNPKHIQKPDYELYKELQEAAKGLIKVVTVAPETDGAIEFIKEMCTNEKTGDNYLHQANNDFASVDTNAKKADTSQCRISIAHTAANASEARAAIGAGAKHITHLYNAMTPMSHRDPGVPGEAADHDDVMVELICDGIHVDPVMIRNTFKLFGSDRIILVSDSMEATGMSDGDYMLGDQKVHKAGNRAELSDGTIAGSATNLFQCMVNAISFGITPEQAIVTATKNPAKEIGIYNQTGSIEKAKRANIVIMTQVFEIIKVITNEMDI